MVAPLTFNTASGHDLFHSNSFLTKLVVTNELKAETTTLPETLK